MGDLIPHMRSFKKLGALELTAVTATVVLTMTGHADVAKDFIVQISFLHGVIWGLIGTSGIVVDDIQSGTIVYYQQKTVSLRNFYAALFVMRVSGLLLAALGLGAALIALKTLNAIQPAEAQRYFMSALLASVLNACIVYAMSAAAIRRDAIAALVYILTTGTVAVRLAAHDGPAYATLRLFLYPVDALGQIVGAAGRREGDFAPGVVLAFQFCVWLLVAYVSTDRGITRALKSRAR